MHEKKPDTEKFQSVSNQKVLLNKEHSDEGAEISISVST